jgi:5-methylcytosine-specific restriction endonuclease McrA
MSKLQEARIIPNGTKVHRLTVQGWFWQTYLHKTKQKRRRMYICLCECGRTMHARSFALRHQIAYSCGCYVKETQAARLSKHGYDYLIRSLMRNYRHSAQRRNHEFMLTYEEFAQLIQSDCYYCGAKPHTQLKDYMRRLKTKDVSSFRYNGIDRLDNARGYVLDNCVTACDVCNNAKSTLSYATFVEWISTCVPAFGRFND